MKLRHFVFVFMAAFAGSFFLASCLNEENRIPPNCYDGILNNGEERIDCGGLSCVECDHCINGLWDPFRGETWRDCGGECPPCLQCSNGIKDGDETGIDCGGICGGCNLLCADGLFNGNEDLIDCQVNEPNEEEECPFCPACDDLIMNGSEVGIDCGGTCSPCCSSGNCRNGIIDGNEFWADCGGRTCPNCLDTLGWRLDGDADFTPSILPIPVTFDGMVLNFENSPSFSGALINVKITRPQVGWINNQTFTLSPTSGTDNFLAYLGVDAVPYTTSATGGLGTVTLVKVPGYDNGAQIGLFIPDDVLDGCFKPAGHYEFFRGSFSGTLFDPSGVNFITIENGIFQVTFFTPI